MTDSIEKKEMPDLPQTEKDWFLQVLVNLANDNDTIQIGITIVTHGFLISGLLVSSRQYFKGFGEEFKKGVPSDDGDTSLQDMFTKMGEDAYNKAKGGNHTTYIHLKDAKVFHPNGSTVPTNTGMWWRGRLSEISGFNLGTLNKE